MSLFLGDVELTFGKKGEDGKSAYEYAVSGGYTGTEAEFMADVAAMGQVQTDISALSAGKIDKVVGAVNGNIPVLDSNGNIYDSGRSNYNSVVMQITLTAAGWVEDTANGWWTQAVSNPAIVDGRKVDISASPAVVKQLSEAGATLVLENNAGTATIYSLGAVPTVDLTIELIISEVTEQ